MAEPATMLAQPKGSNGYSLRKKRNNSPLHPFLVSYQGQLSSSLPNISAKTNGKICGNLAVTFVVNGGKICGGYRAKKVEKGRF